MSVDVDHLIEQLLSVRHQPPQTEVYLDENDIIELCDMAREVFLTENMLLEVDAPINVCGDLHGQYADLLRLFEIGGFPPESRYLFMGDYVDRARQGIETICLLLAFKVKYPKNFFLLRGNHECQSINRIYGFYDECKRRYSVKLWTIFCDCFRVMPVAAVISSRIFCVHGGLSPHMTTIDEINMIKRPCEVPDEGLLCDLLWADPSPDIDDWEESDRGVSYLFGQNSLEAFLEDNDLDLVARAHQVVEDGYEFFADRKLVTVFSAPNYCGEFDNAGAIMTVSNNLVCSFKILRGVV